MTFTRILSIDRITLKEMEIVEYPNVIKVLRRDITYLSDDLLHIAKQLESLNEEFGKYELNNVGASILAESMRGLSKQILDYDDNVLKIYERIITGYENI